MMTALRLNLISLVLILLFYGLVLEHHDALSLNGRGEVSVSGPGYLEASTWEQFALHDGKLVTQAAPVGAQQKDCKT